jgi:hypothetical protein
MEKMEAIQMMRKIRKYTELTIGLILCFALCACWANTESGFLDSGKLQVNGVIYTPYSDANNKCGWQLATPYEKVSRINSSNWAAYKYKYAEQTDVLEVWSKNRDAKMAYLYVREDLAVPEMTFEHIGKVEIFSNDTNESVFLTKAKDAEFIFELLNNASASASLIGVDFKEIGGIIFYCDSIDGACFWYRLLKTEEGEKYYFSINDSQDVLISAELGRSIEALFDTERQ